MNTFITGQEVSARSLCDSDCIFTGTIVKRTDKTVTVDSMGEVRRCKIHMDENGEYIYPYGRYSMAAVFHAA